jgi:hypothetical protein
MEDHPGDSACKLPCATCGADFTLAHRGHMQLTGGDDEFHKCVPGMVCSSWGAPMWYCMHMVARNYPESPTLDQKRQYLAWLTSHSHTLPCCCCRSHFAQHIHKYGLDGAVVDGGSKSLAPFETTRSFFDFLCTLHNDVNRTVGHDIVATEDFGKLYAFYGASQCASPENYGRAFVVIEPGPATRKVLDSIYVNRGVAEQGCRLLGLSNAPLVTCLDEQRAGE